MIRLKRGTTLEIGTDDRVIEIQKRKRKMISDTFNEKKEKQVREARLADLNILLSGRSE